MRNPRIAFIATDTGAVRARNEDRCFAGDWVGDGGDGAWVVPLGSDRWSAAVADGMGGHQAGALASEVAIAELRPLIATLDSEMAVSAAVAQMNDRVFREMHSPHGRPGMGCTIVGISVRGAEAILFNVGDSRAYLVRDGVLLQRSLDHTAGGPASSHGRSHLLTQSLGGTLRRVSLTPHVDRLKVGEKDLVLICSDGLTDMLTEGEIASVLHHNPGDPASALVDAAVEAGGRDNVTVIVIGLANPGVDTRSGGAGVYPSL